VNGRAIHHALAGLGMLLVIAGLAFIVGHCSGCALFERAAPAVDTAGYAAALGDCRAKGKAAKSYEVYEECAKSADRVYGVDGGAP
jgi:hypothetical protein